MAFSLPGEEAIPPDRPPSKASSSEGQIKRRGRKGITKELKLIEDELTSLLMAPAAPMQLTGDGWAASHISDRARPLAKQLIKLAEEKEEFRKQLARLLETGTWGQLLFAAAMYIGPLLIYYGVAPVPPPIKAGLGIPDRGLARAEFAKKMMEQIEIEEMQLRDYKNWHREQRGETPRFTSDDNESPGADILGGTDDASPTAAA